MIEVFDACVSFFLEQASPVCPLATVRSEGLSHCLFDEYSSSQLSVLLCAATPRLLDWSRVLSCAESIKCKGDCADKMRYDRGYWEMKAFQLAGVPRAALVGLLLGRFVMRTDIPCSKREPLYFSSI
jgi:hypothetical protein